MKISAIDLIGDIFSFPRWGRGVFSVWLRNLFYFKQTIFISVFWIVFEPILYLVAIGYGVGQFIGDIQGTSYAHFFAPALMAMTGMMVAFFEATYGSFTKLTKQKTFNTILLAQVSAEEIVVGEIAWAASKGFFSVIAVMAISAQQNLIESQYLMLVLAVLLLTCWLFAAFGMLMAAYAKNYDWFIYAQSGFIIPMSLFSGTYFPFEKLPEIVQKVVLLLPLTHSVMASRKLLSAELHSSVFINMAILFVIATLLTNWATAKMARKILC